jgi:hypothetical protein
MPIPLQGYGKCNGLVVVVIRKILIILDHKFDKCKPLKKADNYHFIKVKKEMTFTLIYWIINQYTLTNIQINYVNRY